MASPMTRSPCLPALSGSPAWAAPLRSFLAAMGSGGAGGAAPKTPGAPLTGGVEISDMDLVELARGGDSAAFRGLVERYQGRVFGIIYGMVRNREDARDLSQDAFVKAYRNLSGFRGDASFHTWLFRIAMNVTIDHIRKHSRVRISEYDDRFDHETPVPELMDPDHLKRHPGKDLERARLAERIMSALQEVSPDHRQVLILREVEGLSYKEIADALGVPEGTVMSRLFYARKRMQEILKDLV